MTTGKFISLEGGDGAGKSTQVAYLSAFLREHGIDVVQTREVGGSHSAETIRKLWLTQTEGYWDPMTELLLVMAARREHLVKTILPAIERGAWVVSDRFVDSTRVYQGFGQELGLEKVDRIYQEIAKDFEPDLTLLFDIPVEVGLSRMTGRGGLDDRFEKKHQDFHQKLRDAFLHLAKQNERRFRVVDATREPLVVKADVEKIIRERFRL
jgi:dTMP kinase